MGSEAPTPSHTGCKTCWNGVAPRAGVVFAVVVAVAVVPRLATASVVVVDVVPAAFSEVSDVMMGTV